MPPEEIVLGGRRFAVMGEGTIDWDCHTMAALRRAGLVPLPRLQRDETHGEYGMRLLVELLAGGNLPELLGTMLVPADIPSAEWTPEIARETAAFVRTLANPADKKRLHNLAVTFLLDFFRDGTASGVISLTSSKAAMGDGPAEKVGAASVGTGNGAVLSVT